MTREEAILALDSLSTWFGHERFITEEIVEAIKTLSYPSFPSNLDEESEKPIIPDELEKEIEKYNKERFDEYFPEQDGDFISEVDFRTCLDRVARHFAQWQENHMLGIAEAFYEQGRHEQKEQMMKDAVEGEVSAVILRENRDEVHYAITYPEGKSPHSITDKVHIIIVKED